MIVVIGVVYHALVRVPPTPPTLIAIVSREVELGAELGNSVRILRHICLILYIVFKLTP